MPRLGMSFSRLSNAQMHIVRFAVCIWQCNMKEAFEYERTVTRLLYSSDPWSY